MAVGVHRDQKLGMDHASIELLKRQSGFSIGPVV